MTWVGVGVAYGGGQMWVAEVFMNGDAPPPPPGKPPAFLRPQSVMADLSLLKWGQPRWRKQLLDTYGVDYSRSPAEDFATGMVTYRNPESGQIVKSQFTVSWMFDKQGLRLSLDGIGPGYAMAASLARPDARTVVMFGDGAFGLSALEFEALARHRLPVVAVIGNDAAWTQIRRGQIQIYGEDRAIATRLEHTRYDQVVQALGGRGYWVERTEDLGPALDGAFAADVPSCVNVRIAASDFRKSAIAV